MNMHWCNERLLVAIHILLTLIYNLRPQVLSVYRPVDSRPQIVHGSSPWVLSWLWSHYHTSHAWLRPLGVACCLFHQSQSVQPWLMEACQLDPLYWMGFPIKTQELENYKLHKTRAPRGTDRSPEYNEHFCYKLDSKVKNLTTEWNQKQQHFITHASRSLLWIPFVAVAFRSEEDVF